jgi:hypothetical protein
MQGLDYRRQIAYLYACENNAENQDKCIGFVKLEERSGRCRLDVQVRKQTFSGTTPGRVYLYFYHRNRNVGLYLGELSGMGNVHRWQGELDGNDLLGKGIPLARIAGVWVQNVNDVDYVARWSGTPVDIFHFIKYPSGGRKCMQCPKFEICERSG